MKYLNLLTIALVLLKVLDLITISWVQAFMPTIISIAGLAIIVAVASIVYVVADRWE